MKLINKGEPEKKHRLIILTDMENEPDDSQTMVKLLMYSNEIDIEGLIAVTSTWLRKEVYPESIYDRVKAYGIVRDNLELHASNWPSEEELLSKVAGGQKGYGMGAVGENQNTKGADLIIKAVDADDPRPVHIAINAGANTLAQALWDVKNTRSEEEVKKFVSKIRVYDDSGQDDAGAWICHTFPEIFYIRSKAQVFGLFGPEQNAGPQPWAPLDQYDWAEKNIRTRHGILGALYPRRLFKDGRFLFMEGGGTASWYGLVNKGLYNPSEISWGGWGGRFSSEKEQIWAGQGNVDELEKKYEPFYMYPETEDYSWEFDGGSGDKEWDEFSGVSNSGTFHSNIFYPLWRWRDAYTRDFKGRMDWCVKSYKNANHHPIAVLFGDDNRTILRAKAQPDELIELDASESKDPDGDLLNFKWYTYPEAGNYDGDIKINNNDSVVANVRIPEDAKNKQIHIILEVTDDNPIVNLTSYRRLVIDVES
ncbi:MAG: nucleoside hydrolase-like domain-containing protein [Halothermotrichaceae bacterium]